MSCIFQPQIFRVLNFEFHKFQFFLCERTSFWIPIYLSLFSISIFQPTPMYFKKYLKYSSHLSNPQICKSTHYFFFIWIVPNMAEQSNSTPLTSLPLLPLPRPFSHFHLLLPAPPAHCLPPPPSDLMNIKKLDCYLTPKPSLSLF